MSSAKPLTPDQLKIRELERTITQLEGTFKGRTTLSKVGPSRIRSKLFLAAVCASTHNPDIGMQKQRLLSAGKTKIQALGAAMRKLNQICFGVVKNQTNYQAQVLIICP